MKVVEWAVRLFGILAFLTLSFALVGLGGRLSSLGLHPYLGAVVAVIGPFLGLSLAIWIGRRATRKTG